MPIKNGAPHRDLNQFRHRETAAHMRAARHRAAPVFAAV
jgi:hypothetical protein